MLFFKIKSKIVRGNAIKKLIILGLENKYTDNKKRQKIKNLDIFFFLYSYISKLRNIKVENNVNPYTNNKNGSGTISLPVKIKTCSMEASHLYWRKF